MKILVTGGEGQLAKSVRPYMEGNDIFAPSRKYLDVTNSSQIQEQINVVNPDIIFHFASLTRGEECARDPEKAWNINVEGTKNIVLECKKNNIPLLFVSTNEVFDGKKDQPYTEEDLPNPITVVGKTKYEAEKIIESQLSKYFIIRTSWLYSNWSQNFLHIVIKKVLKDKKIELVDDEVSSPTYSADLSMAIKKLLSTKRYGLYHIANEGIVSRLELAKKAFEIYKIKDVAITPVHLDEYKRLSRPPLFSALQSVRVKEIGLHLPNWEDALTRFLTSHNLQDMNV